MTARAKTLIFPALAALAAVAGCGTGPSGTNGTPPARPSLSKTEFVARANAICKQTNRRLDEAARKAFPNGEPTPARMTSFLRRHVIAAIEDEVTQIRALPTPAGDEARVKALLDATAQGAQAAKANPNLLQAHDRRDPLFRAIKLARAYGLAVCAAQ